MPYNSTELKQYIQTRASQLGFSFVGFAEAGALSGHEAPLRSWIADGMHGEMHYMANHSDIRIDPRLLLEGTQTIISLAFNYFPAQKQRYDTYQIAKYAYGIDYHELLRTKLYTLLNEIKEKTSCKGRVFTDSAPILEREWARRAGLGWIGKNSLLISPSAGSFFFLAEIIIDLAIAPDKPFEKDFCGQCTRCMDACPTQAIVDAHIVDARKCLSYLTIEYHGDYRALPPPDLSDRIFGCDICQDVCPWNNKSTPHNEPALAPHPDLLNLSKEDWIQLSENEYRRIFQKSAVKRAKFAGIRRNIDQASGKG